MDYLFETANLGFRRFKETDTEKLYSYHNEDSLKVWIPNESYENLDEAKSAIEFFGECCDKMQLPFVLAIELKENSELIGDTGINLAPGGTEIGFSICMDYQGHGYATETVKGMTKYALEKFSLRELLGRVMNGNEATCRVMDKAGYEFVEMVLGAEDDPYGKGMLIYKYTK